MERKIKDELLKWKRASVNKPFFLYGARCVGKTYSVLEFGRKFYSNIAYFNTKNNDKLLDVLQNEKVLDKLISKLSLLSGESIFKEDTLIIFDNVSNEDVIKAFKIFNINNPYHVIMISSSLELVNKNYLTDVYYRRMYTMDFFEYLENTDKAQLVDFIKDSFDNNTAMPFHQMALDAYYEYLMMGGFPEVVDAKINNKSDLEIEAIKQKIIDVYKSEYSAFDLLKCNEIVKCVSSCIVKENKKFQYGTIKKGSRSRNYEDSINYLVGNGIINRSYKLNDVISPLNSMKDADSFKLYYNDVGLLYTSLFMSKTKLFTDDNIKRSLIENDVANNLARFGLGLYYYQSDGKAEINFVVQNRSGKIIPVEVVNMKLMKAKAMSLFLHKYNLSDCIRLTEDNFSKRKGVRMIPLYAIPCLCDI